MRSWIRWSVLIALALILGITAPAVHAKSAADDKIIWGGTYELSPGNVLDGNLRVVDGDATIARGARVQGNASVLGGRLRIEGVLEGDLSVIAGTATIDGTVYGDVQVLGGIVNLGPRAVVMGKVQRVGGILNRDPAAQVGQESNLPLRPSRPRPSFVWPRGIHFDASTTHQFSLIHFITDVLLALLQAVLLAMLAGVIFLFPEKFARRTVERLESQPLMVAGLGLIAVALLPVILIIFIATLILIPLAVVVAVVAGVIALYGWLVLGWYVGERLMQALQQAWHPAISAALGTFLLTLLAAGMNIVPCIGWVPGFLAGAMGLGAVSIVLWETWQEQAHPPNKAESTNQP